MACLLNVKFLSVLVSTKHNSSLTDFYRLAKAKRERLRQAHLAPDYLPLGGASSLLSQDFKHKDMAKNSDSEEEAEEGMRMKFIGSSKSAKYISLVHSDFADHFM